MAKKSLYEKTDKKLQKLSGTIGAIIAIQVPCPESSGGYKVNLQTLSLIK